MANQAPELAFTTLAHHIDIDLLREAFRRTRKDGAVGVDGTAAAEYAINLENNPRSLLDPAKAGTYRGPPVRRVYIPKADGKKLRSLGIPTVEDKVFHRAVERSRWCWRRCTSRTSWTPRTRTDRDGRRTWPSRACARG
ncbi:MAG: hypothetical protein AB1Z98_11010 [Nannocystaceae bacterium]